MNYIYLNKFEKKKKKNENKQTEKENANLCKLVQQFRLPYFISVYLCSFFFYFLFFLSLLLKYATFFYTDKLQLDISSECVIRILKRNHFKRTIKNIFVFVFTRRDNSNTRNTYRGEFRFVSCILCNTLTFSDELIFWKKN